MILFLRNKENRTILDVEIYVKEEGVREYVELSSTLMIEPYSRFLIDNIERADEVISTFDDLCELRGWMWESHFIVKDNTAKEHDNVVSKVKEMLKAVAIKYDLYYAED